MQGGTSDRANAAAAIFFIGLNKEEQPFPP
jgi:hypothetical protein